jgi:Flp pilus assembly protein TadD
MDRAYQANASEVYVAREASLMAMHLGEAEDAIVYAYRATQIKPDDAGLVSNLALAYLLANRLADAKREVERSLKMDPNDAITKWTRGVIEAFIAFKKTPPRRVDDLRHYMFQPP